MTWGKKRETATAEQSVDLEGLEAPFETANETPVETPTHWPEADTTAGVPGTIGATLFLQGDLTGDEDVTIDGKVEGRIEVRGHTVTIGPNANIKAAIQARCVVIQGRVVGDITADEKVEIAATGSLIGDIRANRVVLAESARFRGRIDMGWEEHDREAQAQDAETPTTKEDTARPTTRDAVLGALDWDKAPTKRSPAATPKGM
ncbi:MAG TPA: polymer-forming cytoskeletal protein [Planctomycetota bacterium]